MHHSPCLPNIQTSFLHGINPSLYTLLGCGLGHRRASTLQGFHIAVATPKCDISSKLRFHPLGNAPCIPLHKPPPYTPVMHHSPCLLYIQTSFPQAILHGINPPLSQPTQWATTSTLSYIDPLSSTVILHSIHIAEPSENTFINPFMYTLCYSTQFPKKEG